MDSAFLFDDSVLYEGKVFEAGVYPDKDFAIGLEELEAKAVPAQREHLIALFKSAACADGNGAAQFSAEGQIATGANLTALRNLFKDAQPHSLFSTQILNADPNADSQAPDPSMVEKLRGATRLGQMTTRQERA